MKIIVVGGGVSGISAAYYLGKAGHDVTLLERDPELGGRAGCAQLGDRTIDIGGKNLGRSYQLFRSFVGELGGGNFEEFGINTSTQHRGKTIAINTSNRLSALSKLLQLSDPRDLPLLAKLGTLARRNGNGLLGSDDFAQVGERHRHATLDQVFCKKTAQSVLRPATVRMNGAEPDEYFVGNLGTNLKMLSDEYDQLTDGLQPLFHKAKAHFNVRTSSLVETLRRNASGFEVTLSQGSRVDTLQADGIVIALPAGAASSLVKAIVPTLGLLLDTVTYHPVGTLVADYAENVFDTAVRAYIFGPEYYLSNAGAYGKADLNLVRYTFSGRRARTLLAQGLEPQRLLEIAEQELRHRSSLSIGTARSFTYKMWEAGLCSYSKDHRAFLRSVESELRLAPGLALAGDYMLGASIEACFQSGQLAAETSSGERSAPRKASEL